MEEKKMNYSNEIEGALVERNITFIREQSNERTCFMFPMHINNMPLLYMEFVISENNEATFSCLSILSMKELEESKYMEILKMLNNLNCKYKFMKFYLDDSKSICAEYDCVIYGDGAIACEQVLTTMFRLKKIISHCIEDIMRTIWR